MGCARFGRTVQTNFYFEDIGDNQLCPCDDLYGKSCFFLTIDDTKDPSWVFVNDYSATNVKRKMEKFYGFNHKADFCTASEPLQTAPEPSQSGLEYRYELIPAPRANYELDEIKQCIIIYY